MTYTAKYKQMRKHILKRDDYTCSYCGQEATTVDHVIPLSKGGEDHEQNLVAACITCNYGKRERDADKFRQKKYAEKFTHKREFFDRAVTPIDSFIDVSPKDFGVFEPLKNERI